MVKRLPKVVLVLLLGTCLTLGGCSAGQFEQYLSSIAPAVSIILQIVSIATGTPFNQGLASKVKADTTAVNALYKDYESASASNKSGVQGDIDAGFAVLNQDLAQVFQLGQVSSEAARSKIVALVGLVQQFVKLGEGLLPGKVTAARGAVVQAKASALRDSFNATLHAKTGDPGLDQATAKMKLPGSKHAYMLYLK